MFSDGLRFIYSSIIKVIAIIIVSYFIANLVFFGIFYFKFLGIANEVSQVAMQNNYIPPTEKSIINRSIQDIANSSQIISDAYISVGDNMDIDRHTASNNRTQYGTSKTVGVHFKFKWVWPLMPEEYGMGPTSSDFNLENIAKADGAVGTGLEAGKSNLSDDQLDSMREAKASYIDVNINYNVPGLQYYADLD